MKSSTLILVLTFSLLTSFTLASEPIGLNPLPSEDPLFQADHLLTASTFLKTPTTDLEVAKIIADCAERTDALLVQLAKATTEQETGSLIREIHHLETVRELDILALYIHEAEMMGRYPLAKTLKDWQERVRVRGRALVASTD